jgi:hypothetical protein
MNLDRPDREPLLRQARQIAQDAPAAVLKQAAAALAILRQQGPEALRVVLAEAVPYHVEASARHWAEFRRRAGPAILAQLDREPAAAAYLLTWLKRLAVIQEARERERQAR